MSSDPNDQVLAMQRNLAAKTGVSWPEWLQRGRAAGSSKHGEIVKHLKTVHGIGHGYANLIAHLLKQDASADTGEAGGAVPTVGDGSSPVDDLVAAQYAGKKADLRPIYERLAAAVAAFGDDVELAPKKTYVSLRRKKQFGLVQPSTATRVDVGLNLKGRATSERLEASGSFNAMVTHRVRLSSAADVDASLLGWLREAYDAAG